MPPSSPLQAPSPIQTNLDAVASAMQAKAHLPVFRALILSLLGGAYIALAGFASTVASCNLLSSPENYGLGRLVTALVFPAGLIFIVIGGGELFTGNCLMTGALRRGLVTRSRMLRSWCLVYAGNLLGSILVSLLLHFGGSFLSGGGQVAAAVIRTGAAKAALPGLSAFMLAILCNWLVCLAVWLATRAEAPAHKALMIFVPISIFVLSGFEHSVANMYYLSAALLAAADPLALSASGLSSIGVLDLGSAVHNLFWVTLGNIAGGAVFVEGAYALACGDASRR